MVQISDYRQFKDVFQKTKQKFGTINSNCLLPNKVVSEALTESSVYLEEYPEGFVMFTEWNAPALFYKIYYFIGDINSFPKISPEKPLLLEELDVNGKRSEYLDQISASLNRSGFTEAAKNIMVETKCSDPTVSSETDKILSHLESMNYRIEMDPHEVSTNDIADLWKNNLKKTDIPHEHYSSLKNGNSHIVCVFDPNNTVCGVNWWQYRNTVCEIRHTVTRADVRRKKIGSLMILFALDQAYKNNCRTAYTYIDSNNTSSITMYEKAGFTKNGKVCKQFILPMDI